MERKALRIILYEGPGRIQTIREIEVTEGYAAGFRGALKDILGLTPTTERIIGGIRSKSSIYPEIAIRELVANAFIHQDFSIAGSGPMIEVFSDRIEITNPGTPLIPIDRLLDLPPVSRNEGLGGLMRQFGICEERGSGVDKVITAIEAEQLPPPDFQMSANHTRVIIFSRRPWTDMTQDERIRATYQHASLQWSQSGYLTNASLRKRFALGDEKASAVSRVIKDAVETGRIRQDGGTRRSARYVPYYVTERPEVFSVPGAIGQRSD